MNGTTNKRSHDVLRDACPPISSTSRCSSRPIACDRSRSTKDNLDNQRNAVQEERRLGVDNQPYGKTFEDTLEELAYDELRVQTLVIGSMADLNAATVEDVASFFKTYYAPNNAVARDRRGRRREDGARESRRSISARFRGSRDRRRWTWPSRRRRKSAA